MNGVASFRPRWDWLIVLVALGLLACGGAGEDVAPPPPESSSAVESGDVGEIDACEIVTQEDASALFGQPASPQEGTPVLGGAMLGQCLWTWDTETSNQLLQFSIWTAVAYEAPEDSEPVDLGEEGYVRAHPMAGVDVAWIQGGRMISLAYSTIGPDAPKAPSRVEEVKALAREVANRM